MSLSRKNVPSRNVPDSPPVRVHPTASRASFCPVLSGQGWEPAGRPLIGLSTDFYFPDLSSLVETFSPDFLPEYLEIFRGRTVDLAAARQLLPPGFPLTYHGDGLWYTQPDFPENPAYREEIVRANKHMQALDGPWMIHECAQKQMEGYAFGLYAPPVLSPESAEAARLGALALARAISGRLLLVETPPFPPHSPGSLDLAAFFGLLTRDTQIGIGLDIGHCLTYLSASGQPMSPERLVTWLRNFPLERVVEIHLGGFWEPRVGERNFPIDDHSRPVPDLLFDALAAVLGTFSLEALRGIALEVDNKPLSLVTREFPRFASIVRKALDHRPISSPPSPWSPGPDLHGGLFEAESDPFLPGVRAAYRALAEELMHAPDSPYATNLFADEIWEFGGNMDHLFPETLAILNRCGIPAKPAFVGFFNSRPRSERDPFDFLKIKIRRTLEWVVSLSGELPDHSLHAMLLGTAEREAAMLLSAQDLFNGDPL